MGIIKHYLVGIKSDIVNTISNVYQTLQERRQKKCESQRNMKFTVRVSLLNM